MSQQLEMFKLDDQLNLVEELIKKVRKRRDFFSASELATETTRVLDIITNRPWTHAVKMGLGYAHAWCLPGNGGCGKNRIDHESGRLCIERD